MAVVVTVELFVLVDQNGNYAVGVDRETAAASYADTIQDLSEVTGLRSVAVAIDVPLPRLIEVSGKIPSAEETTELTVA